MRWGNFTLYWFSLNISKTLEAVVLAICSVSYHFIRDIHVKFRVLNLSQCLYIEQNVDGGISDFRISSQSFINKNCPNSRTSYDTDIKHGTVTKLDKRNTAIPKKLTTTSCQQIVTYLSFFQFMVNLEQSRSQIFDAWSIKHTFTLSHKNRTTELRHSQQSPCIIPLSRGTIFAKKC